MTKLYPCEAVILAEDFDALVAWYRDVLGFELIKRFEGEYHYANLETATGIKLGIAKASEMKVTPADRSQNTVILQYRAEDVSALLERVSQRGGAVQFGPSFNEKDQFWYGAFSDLEGNRSWVVDMNCP